MFLNRKHSIQPFTKGLPSGDIMESLTEVLDAPASPNKRKRGDKDVSNNNNGAQEPGKPDARAIIKQAVARAAGVHKQGTLLRISFETLFEYIKVRLCRRCCSFLIPSSHASLFLPLMRFLIHAPYMQCSALRMCICMHPWGCSCNAVHELTIFQPLGCCTRVGASCLPSLHCRHTCSARGHIPLSSVGLQDSAPASWRFAATLRKMRRINKHTQNLAGYEAFWLWLHPCNWPDSTSACCAVS